VKLSAALSILVGLAVAIGLIAAYDAAAIGQALLDAGWGILLVVALHLPQTLFSGLGWRTLVTEPGVPGWPLFCCLRWVRESVNSLLPVAQIGGEIVRVRLLALRGVSLRTASASAVADLTAEMASQIVFTLLGVFLLLLDPRDPTIVHWSIAIIIAAIVISVAFVAAQRLGLFRLFERLIMSVADKLGWPSLNGIEGLHDTIIEFYRNPRRLWGSGGLHLVSWLLGTLETLAALHVLGIEAGLREALIIESLSQAVRSAGFIVPGALGIQEGGYIVICGLLGISPQQAIELSLLRRIREVILGVPGLLAWHRLEARFAGRTIGMEEALPGAAWRGSGQ